MESYGNGGVAVGSIISGRFRVDDILGVGGMGVVVAATHLELGYRVAIKFMRDELVARPDIVERFLREARAVVRLGTEHVCKVLDVARLDSGAPYIVMEYLQGTDLAHAVLRQPLPVSIAVDYMLQACVALGEAHQAGIIHRDLKPANMFVTRRPDGGPLVKVLDFGIAKGLFETNAALTRTRMMMGSPGYMSPEQMESAKDVDARTDIWALGVSLYQLLSARLPFAGRNATEIAIQIGSAQPAPLEVDPALQAIVFRCLQKRPDARYPDVVSLAADLAPFGGPAGRRTAAMVAQAANQPAPTSLVMPAPMPSMPSMNASMPVVSNRMTTMPGTNASMPVTPNPMTGVPGTHASMHVAPNPMTAIPGMHGSMPVAPNPRSAIPGMHASMPVAPNPMTAVPGTNASMPVAPNPMTAMPGTNASMPVAPMTGIPGAHASIPVTPNPMTGVPGTHASMHVAPNPMAATPGTHTSMPVGPMTGIPGTHASMPVGPNPMSVAAQAPLPGAPATPHTGRRRSVAWYLVPAVVVVAGIVVIAIAAGGRNHASPSDASVASTPRDASTVVVSSADAGPADAAVVVSAPSDANVDDAGVVASADDAGTPSIVLPIDLTKLRKMPGMPSSAQIQQSLQMAAGYCKQFLDGKGPIALPPEALFGCACMIQDAARAQALVDKAPANKQANMRNTCKQFGVTLK